LDKVLEQTAQEVRFATAVLMERWEEDATKDLMRIYSSLLVGGS